MPNKFQKYRTNDIGFISKERTSDNSDWIRPVLFDIKRSQHSNYCILHIVTKRSRPITKQAGKMDTIKRLKFKINLCEKKKKFR